MKTATSLFAHHVKPSPRAAVLLGLLCVAWGAHAADVFRADTADTLDVLTAWTGGVLPTSADVAVWNNTVQANTGGQTLNTDASWAGIRIADPAAAITLNAGNTLTLGASGIDMSAATVNLTLASAVNLSATQTWSIATNRTITGSGTIGDSDGSGKVLIINGPGTFNPTVAPSFLGRIIVTGGATLNGVAGIINSVGNLTLSNGTYSLTTTAGTINLDISDNTTNTFNSINSTADSGLWTGGGTLLIVANAAGRVFTVNGSMAAFNGTVRMASGTGLGQIRANAAANSGGTNVTFDMGNNASGSLNKNTGAGTFYIGALFGGPNTSVTSGLNPETFDIGYKSDSLFSGIISGANVFLNKSGPTTLILAGANTYGRTTTISNGVLQVGNGGVSGALPGGNVTNFATLAFNRSDIYAFTNVITGSGNVSNLGTGTLVLTGTNTHTGKTIIAAGTLLLPNQAGLGATPVSFAADNLILNGGALGATNNSGLTDANRGLTLGVNGGWLAPGAGVTLTISNVISGAGNLIVSNAGTVLLTTANAYTGKTILNSGVLAIGDESSLGANPGAPAADQLTFNGGTLSNTAAFAIDDANRGVTLGAAGATLNTSGGALTVAEVIAGTGALNKTGSGTLSLTRANTYLGNTVINQGTLALGASGAIASSPVISVAAGATFDVSAVSSFALASGQTLGGNGTVSGNVTAGAGSTLSAGTNGIGQLNITGNLTLSGGTNLVEITSATNDVINLTGNLTRTGGSTIQLNVQSGLSSGRRVLLRYSGTLAGAGSFNLVGAPGGTTLDTSVAHEVAIILNIAAGNLAWQGDGSLNVWDVGTSANWTNGVAATTFNNGDNVTFSDTGSQTPAINLVSPVQPGTVTVNASGNYTIGGAGKITGVGSFTKINSGTLTLLTRNDYSGNTFLAQGIVLVGNGSTGGSLGTGTVTNNTTLIFNLPGSATNSGDLNGTGSLTVQAGALTLAGNGSYSGPTTNAVGATLNVGAGGSSGSLGGGAVQNDGALIFNLTSSNLTAAAIVGAGTLTKQGSGTVALAGTNSYAGATTISAGTLQVGAGGATGTLGSAPTVTDNATLAFNRSDSYTNSAQITGTGGLVQQGAGTLTLMANNTYAGVTTISGGGLQLGDGVTPGTLGTGNVTDNGALIVNRPDDFFLTNIISGTGTLIKVGPNTLRFDRSLANANTYSGGTIISNGTIRLGPDANGDPGAANVNSLGSGPLTFYGGTLWCYNAVNGGLNVGPAFSGPIIVPAGQSGTVLAPQNGTFSPSAVTGSGSLTVVAASTRNSVAGTWSAFAGQMVAAGGTAGFQLTANNFSNAGILVTNGTVLGYIGGNNATIRIGELTGDGTLGSVSQSSTSPTWMVGSKNTAATFNGTIANVGTTSVTKVGTNVWTITGTMGYTGPTTISNGVLALATNSAGTDSDISGSTLIRIISPGIFDVSRLTTTPGTFTANQAVAGNGTVRGGLILNADLTTGPSTTNLGNFTVTSNLVVNGTVNMKIDHSGFAASDQVVCTNITVNGATLNITEISTNDLQTGDTFKLFSTPVLGPGFSAINITPTTTQDGSITYGWDLSRLAVNGTIVLTNGGAVVVTVNTNPATANFTAVRAGNSLQLSWAPDHLGWQLYTNAAGLASTGSWFPVAGSANVTNQTIVISPAIPSVFFQLRYP
jgi:autotransporter-associated beta strand protein